MDHYRESNFDIPFTLSTPVSSMWLQCSLPTVKFTTLKMPSNIDNFFTDVDVTVYFPLGMPSINMGTQSLG